MAMSLAAAAASTRQFLSDVNPDGSNPFIEKLLVQIYKHFDGQHLIDVTFKLTNPTAFVTAHRLILSAASPYFKELFQSGAGICPLIEISDIDSDTFERLITFCYTGKTLISIDNVESMLKASLILQLDDAVTNCVDFLIEHITDYTLERAYALEREAQCELLSEQILEYERGNFMTVIESAEFLKFDACKLQTILESDDLNVRTEKDVFEAVKVWYEHDAFERKQQLHDLIACLRLTQFDTNFLLRNIQPLLGCHFLAVETLTWINCPLARSALSIKYTKPRLERNVMSEESFLAVNIVATVHNGHIFVVGGIDGNTFRTVERFDPQKNEWSKICSLSNGLKAVCCISIDNQLWAVGGYKGRYKNYVSVYDEQNDKWIDKKPMPMVVKPTSFRIAKLSLQGLHSFPNAMAMALAAAAAGSSRQNLSDVNPDGTNHFINKLLFQIYEHFDEQHLIDVTFKLSNPTALVTAHRLVLSAASPYFKQLFKTDQGMCPIMEINNIDANTFERLITFCYTGITVITMDNVDRMLKASLILQLDDAVMTCFNFIMEHMTDYTLQRAYGLESELQCAILTEKILHYETKNFMNVIRNPAFLNFDASKLQKILERDDLNVSTERDAFEAVRRWYEHDVPARQQQLPKIISCLRLTQFDTNFLLSNIQPLPGCHFMALEALTWINIPSSRATISLKFTNSRKSHRAEHSDDTTFLALNRYGPNPKSKIIFKYNKSKDLWQKWIDFQMDVVDFATVFMEDNLIFIGGSLNSKIINKVTSWNVKTKTFKQLPPMNEPRRLHCAVILNDKIYAIGGSGTNDNVLRTVEMCSVSHGWKQIKKMNIQRCNTSAVGLNGKMYVMGGYNGSSLKSVECYDPTKNCWSQCADMNEVRCHPSVTVHNGQIFVVGGWKEREASPTVERYDPQRDEWTKIRSLGYGRQLACCISFDNQLWVVGGKNKTLKDSVSVYNEEKCKWNNKTPMPMIGQYYCFTAPKALLESGQRK